MKTRKIRISQIQTENAYFQHKFVIERKADISMICMCLMV